MKTRNRFTAVEAQQIRNLLRLKIKSGNEKRYRHALRNIGFYISQYEHVKEGFAPEDFDRYVAAGCIVITDNITNVPQDLTIQEALTGLPPVVSHESRVVILGTFPGRESLRLKQYYASPTNQFWTIVESLLHIGRHEPYSARIGKLTQHGIALWDVIRSCARRSSSDKNITNECPNDFSEFFRSFPEIRKVCFNGRAARDYFEGLVLSVDVPRITLPSTSAANASLTLLQKAEAWKQGLTSQV